MSLFAIVYLVVIILFIVVRINRQKKKKDAERKTWTPPRRAGGNGFPHGGQGAGGFFPGGSAAESRKDVPLPELLRQLMGEPEDVPRAGAFSPAGAGDEDPAVETAWKAFRSGGEPESFKPPERESLRPAPKPAEAAISAFSAPAFPVKDPPPPPAPETAHTETGGREGAAAMDFSTRLARLGPLGQAIVMAEVLGKPKGLSDF
ncbi:MAG: hypothetical protein LBQ57_09155 [Spirochaetales bacterium]|nr:hypothetical protein [Spirochaetales bacterium]